VGKREARRRGRGGREHSPPLGGSLARCLARQRTGTGPLPPRGQPRTRPLTVPAVTYPLWPRPQELTGAVLPAPGGLSLGKLWRVARRARAVTATVLDERPLRPVLVPACVISRRGCHLARLLQNLG